MSDYEPLKKDQVRKALALVIILLMGSQNPEAKKSTYKKIEKKISYKQIII
jgi:hypothetical protein